MFLLLRTSIFSHFMQFFNRLLTQTKYTTVSMCYMLLVSTWAYVKAHEEAIEPFHSFRTGHKDFLRLLRESGKQRTLQYTKKVIKG